eukprot:1158893-Pelagomonas_calceolata.AAC.16
MSCVMSWAGTLCTQMLLQRECSGGSGGEQRSRACAEPPHSQQHGRWPHEYASTCNSKVPLCYTPHGAPPA